MKPTARRPWMQFSLRSLLVLMLVVAAFFAGRMSLQQELTRARELEAKVESVQAALAAEKEGSYRGVIARIQWALEEGGEEIVISDHVDFGAEPAN